MIMQAELIRIKVGAQLAVLKEYRKFAPIPWPLSQNMTTKSDLTLKCHKTLNSFVKERAVKLLWIH